MHGNELLSICCLGYKHAPFIKDCITSLWKDSWFKKEIIALDDGSDDGSVEILRELQKESPCPFTVLEQNNTGNVPANFNRLFRESHGDFIVFTSLDDMQIPGSLECRMEHLLSDKNCVFVAHTKALAREEKRTLRLELTPLTGKVPDAAKALEIERTQLHSFFIQGATFRRSIIDDVRGFNENMIGDDIVLRTKIYFHLISHRELKFKLIDEPGFIYRKHTGNLSSNVIRQLKLAFQYYDKFWRDKQYPQMLKSWLLTGLSVEPFEKIIEMFALNSDASIFLYDKDIKKALCINAAKSYLLNQKNR